jgi:hypothetical protein
MKQTVKKTPFARVVRDDGIRATGWGGAKKRTYEVRRETNEEVMTEALLQRGEIRIRVAVQIKKYGGNFVGYHGASFYTKVGSIKEARELVANLKKSLED